MNFSFRYIKNSNLHFHTFIMNYDTEIIEKVCSNFELYVSVEVKPSQTKIDYHYLLDYKHNYPDRAITKPKKKKNKDTMLTLV